LLLHTFQLLFTVCLECPRNRGSNPDDHPDVGYQKCNVHNIEHCLKPEDSLKVIF
jgi:hypothetical protein